MFPPRPLPEGALVILKSGGPLMTTERAGVKDLIAAIWFNGAELKREVFHMDALAVIGFPMKPNDDEAAFNKAMESAANRREAQVAKGSER